MDIGEYIQSGIIEQYVLGLANAEETAELEQLRNKYPELKEAILNFEKTFERHLTLNKVKPPAIIKSLLEKELFGKSSLVNVAERPALTPNFAVWKYLAAACIILLITSTALNFYFYSGYKKSQLQYEALLSERNTLQANNVLYEQSLQMFQDTSMEKIRMTGRAENFATVLWNKNSKDVYIYSIKMQQIPAGKQYQLWAIVNGKPVDAGLITNCTGVCKLNRKIEHPEAFAITLEKEGGSLTPTLTEMYVSGKVQS
jgi:anti-sigma-K factor RskA